MNAAAPKRGLAGPLSSMESAPALRDALQDQLHEQAVLAAILLAPKVLDALPSGFGPQHFAFDNHGEIFEAAVAAAQTGATFLSPLVETALPALSGRDGYIRSLPNALLSSRPSDVAIYAERLMTLADRRALVALAEQLRFAAIGGDGEAIDTRALASRAAEELDWIAGRQQKARRAVPLAQAVDEAMAAGEKAAASQNGLSGLSTGFRTIDRRLGGMEPGQLIVLGGRPGMGKTALGLQIALRAATPPGPEVPGAKVLFVSLEMQAAQIGRRALALSSGIRLQALRRGEFTRDQAMAHALVRGRARLSSLQVTIEDEPALHVAAIALRARSAARAMGGIDLMVVDHLHIVGRPETAGRFGDTQAITEISGGMKRLAKDLGVPLLLLAQLSRGLESRDDKRPTLADLRQSGAIEQDADAIMFLYRPEYYLPASPPERKHGETDEKHQARQSEFYRQKNGMRGRAEVIFAKVRDGEPGTEHLRFNAEQVRFHEQDELGADEHGEAGE